MKYFCLILPDSPFLFSRNLLLLPIQGLSLLTRSEAKGIVVSISFLDDQCPVFQQDDKSMFATASIQEASSLHDYAISFGILVFLPPFVLCLVVFLHLHFLFCLLVKHPTRILEISFPTFLFSFCLLLLIPTFRYHTVRQASK
jgi:hypothetical protein